MSNTPSQQAELYRKAAETIEMCAEHGIEPCVKNSKTLFNILRNSIGYVGSFEEYEFPIAVIEGQLVWADAIVYNSLGRAITAKHMKAGMDYWLTEPKRIVMVELLIEDAEYWAEYNNRTVIHEPSVRLYGSCRKALDNLK